MQGKSQVLYVLCGLASKDSEDFKAELQKAAQENGYEIIFVNRYRKEGISQYISEHPEFRTLVLQEAMQANYPYTADELSELMDHYHLNIVISIQKAHRGTDYMKKLYVAGILNALYEEDATPQNVLKRILYPRIRAECRKYYQISNAKDAESALDIVDERKMKQYVSYIEEAKTQEEVIGRYRHIAGGLKMVENIYLANNLSLYVQSLLDGDSYYREAMGLSDSRNRKKCLIKRGNFSLIFNPKGKVNKTDEEQMPVFMEEQAVKEQKKTGVEQMVDEDISDLLGFPTTEKTISFQNSIVTEEKRENEVVVPNTEKGLEKLNGMSLWNLVAVGIFIAIILFAVLILVL